MEWLRQAASHEKVVAIGEIGLDYYWDKENREVQKRWFREQLRLAKEMHLPVIIHSREAAADTWEVMKSEHLEDMTGVIHCFSYSKEMAENYLKSGFYLGIGGVITFKNAKKLVEVVECAPLSQLLLETDCPYLAPVPYRGKRNSSLYLPYMAERIAEIKGVTPEEVIRVTWENACRMYGVPASPGAVAAETDTAETDRAILPGNPADDSIMYGVNAKDNAQDARRKGD